MIVENRSQLFQKQQLQQNRVQNPRQADTLTDNQDEDIDYLIKVNYPQPISYFNKLNNILSYCLQFVKAKSVIRIILIVYLVAPPIYLMIYLYLSLQYQNFYLGISSVILFGNSKYKKQCYQIPLQDLQNINSFLKWFLIIFDLEYVYLLIRNPNSIDDLIQNRNLLLKDKKYFDSQILMQILNFFQFDKYFLSFQSCYILLFQASLGVSIRKYRKYYPFKQGKKIEECLNNKTFAVSLLHICSFILILLRLFNSKLILAVCYIVFLAVISLIYYSFFKVEGVLYHVAIDVPFTKENLSNPELWKKGFTPYTKGVQLQVVQKIALNLLFIAFIITQFDKNVNMLILAYDTMLTIFSILSMIILINRNLLQTKAVFGQNFSIIETNTNEELSQHIQNYKLNPSYFKNVSVVNILQRSTQTKDMICCLFYCFNQAQINCKFYSRLNLLNSINSEINQNVNQAISIYNITDLLYLNFKNGNKEMLPQISHITVNQISQNNLIVYKILILSDFLPKIEVIGNVTCPLYLTFVQYQNTFASVILSSIMFNKAIRSSLLNNPLQVFYNLYE